MQYVIRGGNARPYTNACKDQTIRNAALMGGGPNETQIDWTPDR